MSVPPTARAFAFLLTAATAAISLSAGSLPASASSSGQVPAQFVVHSFAAVGNETNPDDITRLGNSIYVTFQNGVGPLGEASPSGATTSTIQEYSLSGKPGKSWSVQGKVDGLTAQSSRHRLLLTSNEDGNSSFLTLDPGEAAAPNRYSYAGVNHGGGTDAIAVIHDSIVVSASNPSNPAGAAAYRVSLEGAIASLTPVVNDNSIAISANTQNVGQPVKLALTDPDSNQVVPRSSPRFAGYLMIDAQADKQLLFLGQRGSEEESAGVQVLSVAQPLDDTVFATRMNRTLWATDATHNKVIEITGPFSAGEAVSTVTPDAGNSSLARLNLNDGTLTPIPQLAAVTPKGLLFTSPADADPRDGSDR